MIRSMLVIEALQKHFDLIVKIGHRTESLFHTPADRPLMRQTYTPTFLPLLIANIQKWKSKLVVMARALCKKIT